MTENVLGNFQHCATALEVNFRVAGSCEHSEWQKNHINSCFIADFAEQAIAELNVEDIQHSVCDTVNYVANELLEDAMLCRQGSEYSDVSIRVCVDQNQIALFIANPVCADALISLRQRLSELLTEDPQSQYLSRLTNENDSSSEFPALQRYMSMMADHQVELAWKIERSGDTAAHAWVTTMSSVPLGDVQQRV